MVIVVANEHGDTRLDETDCISLSTNTLRKGINPIILHLWVNSRADWFLQPY